VVDNLKIALQHCKKKNRLQMVNCVTQYTDFTEEIFTLKLCGFTVYA